MPWFTVVPVITIVGITGIGAVVPVITIVGITGIGAVVPVITIVGITGVGAVISVVPSVGIPSVPITRCRRRTVIAIGVVIIAVIHLHSAWIAAAV